MSHYCEHMTALGFYCEYACADSLTGGGAAGTGAVTCVWEGVTGWAKTILKDF